MRKLFSLGALLTLVLAGCSNAANTLVGPDDPEPSFACAGNSGNCGGGSGGGGAGGNRNNNPNNPPATTP